MQLRLHADPAAFLAVADPLLAPDEARHSLIYGICTVLGEFPTAYPEASLWTVEDDEPLAALLRTPPYNFVVARPANDDALVFAAEHLKAEGAAAPGVAGGMPEADVFAHAWTDTPRVRMEQGVYSAHTIRVPEGVPGEMRLATFADLSLVVEWLRAFADEALPDEEARVDPEEATRRRLSSKTAGIALWEDAGRPVSMCGYGGQTPHGMRIAPVYTPPELRRRGYGSAVTAAASSRLLDSGRDFCFLHTDLANPTSNKIYADIGYELVCRFADYSFDA